MERYDETHYVQHTEGSVNRFQVGLMIDLSVASMNDKGADTHGGKLSETSHTSVRIIVGDNELTMKIMTVAKFETKMTAKYKIPMIHCHCHQNSIWNSRQGSYHLGLNMRLKEWLVHYDFSGRESECEKG